MLEMVPPGLHPATRETAPCRVCRR